MVRRLYPYGKKKAFNITYDDGVVQDRRFVAMLNRYAIPGTFSLNSGLMEQGFTWVHPCGMTVERLSPEEARELYAGHEVACHTLTHPDFQYMPREAILWEMRADKEKLEALFGREIPGFAVPFDYYDGVVRDCVREAGFAYGRNARESQGFGIPEDPWDWTCTLFHLRPNLVSVVERFLETDEEMALCQIVGHAYDLDAENLWDTMEDLLRRIRENDDVLPMTHIDLVRYLNAMDQVNIYGDWVENHSNMPLWFEINGQVHCIDPI